MINDHSTIEEYTEYIKEFSLDELLNIASYINKHRHPDRYELLIERIEALQKSTENSLPATNFSLKQKYFASPANAAEPPAPLKYIILGLLFLLLFWFWGVIANQIDFIRYRPWIAVPTAFIAEYIFFIGIMIFAVIICKKLLYWPLINSESYRKTFKSFFKLILLFIPIRFAIGLIVLIIGALSNKTIEETQFMRFVALGPNNWTVIIFLFTGFTIWPVVEEFFFRGFLYSALKTRISLGFAVIVQAVIFSLYHHYDLLGSITVFLIGVVLALIYEKSKNLLAPIFMHVIWNAFIMVPILILSLQNLHPVAKSWEEAIQNPKWLFSAPPAYIDRQSDGLKQWENAIDTWGSRGARKWKMEANAFNAIPLWFPEDIVASAKAKIGIVTIYSIYLQDHRRAILTAKELLNTYPGQREQCASALAKMGWSYYMIKDFNNSRKAFETVQTQYSDYEDSVESAKRGLEWLQKIKQ